MIGAPGPPRWARSADGVRIAYEIAGNGPIVVILVHGWCCHRGFWARQVESLHDRFTVVTLDLGGHGQSGLGRARWSMPAFGGDVAAVAEALEARRVVLVGHSMAGSVVAEAARLLRARPLAMVGVETYWDLLAESSPEMSRVVLEPFLDDPESARSNHIRSMFLPDADPQLVARVRAAMAKPPAGVAVGALEEILASREALRQSLATICKSGIPVALINSADWRPTRVAGLETYGITLRTLSGTGHFPMLEDPPAFNRLLEETLGSVLAD